MTQHVLLIGFPRTFVARKTLEGLLEYDASSRVTCVVAEQYAERARTWLSHRSLEERERVDIVIGESWGIDFGLPGSDYMQLARSIEVIHHCGALTYPDVGRETARRVNVNGTVEVVELAEAARRLDRLVLWSSASVSQPQHGLATEQELIKPSRFRGVIEETRYQAEVIVRAEMDHIPTTILRPSIIVGDSHTGEIDRFEGPYLLILLMVNSPVDLRVPLPGRGDIPLNLVPIDYVVRAGLAISNNPRAAGHTFHLIDPNPPTVHRVFEMIAEAAGRRAPVGNLPTNLATAVLRTPGLERFAQIPRTFLEQLATEISYDARNAREMLAGTGIECPPVRTYLPTLVEYVRTKQKENARVRRERRRSSEAVDPLEPNA